MRHEEIVPPPPHRFEQGHILTEEGKRGGVQMRARVEPSPLDKYLASKDITKEQHRAGRRYHALWLMSEHQHHHVQIRYAEYSGGSGDYERRFVISKEFVEAGNAIRDVLPKFYARKVCLDEQKAGRGNMLYLKAALDDLARHFKEVAKQERAALSACAHDRQQA